MEVLMKIRNGTAEGFYPAFAPPVVKKGIFTESESISIQFQNLFRHVNVDAKEVC